MLQRDASVEPQHSICQAPGSAVRAGHPQHVARPLVVDVPPEHEEVIRQSIEIFERFRVDLGRPRELEVKRSAAFTRYEEQIWRLLANQRATSAAAPETVQ